MRYILLMIVWGWVTFLSAQTTHEADSIYTLKQVLKVHLTYPDSAFQLLDKMEQLRKVPTYLLDAQRSMVYSAHRKYKLTANYAQKALQHDSLKNHPKYYLQALSCSMEANRQLGEYKKCLQILHKGIDFARKEQNLAAEVNFTFTAGQTHYLLNNKEEAFRYFNQAIQIAENHTTYKVKPYLSFIYGDMSRLLTNEDRYQEALDYCHKREKLIQQMGSFKKIPLGYLDQQYAYLYSKQAHLLSKLNRKKEAAECYRLFKQTRYSQSPDGKDAIVPYWMDIQHYDAIIQLYQQQEAPTDTINQEYIHALSNLAQAYYGKKQYQQAYNYQKRLTAITDSVNQQNTKEEIAELATIYQLKEKENEILLQKQQIQKAITIRNLLLGAFILACILLWVLIYHIRTIQKKNRLMANSLNTVMTYEEKINVLEQHLSEQDVDSSTDYTIFKKIEKVLKEENAYLNPEMNRQWILDKLSIDKNIFSQVMQQHTQMSLPQYLAELRIKHAILEMKTHPNYTMQAIAYGSGFNNLRNFQRSFKIVTGMTPSEYKEASLYKKNTISE